IPSNFSDDKESPRPVVAPRYSPSTAGPAPGAASCISPLSSHTFPQWHSVKCRCFWCCGRQDTVSGKKAQILSLLLLNPTTVLLPLHLGRVLLRVQSVVLRLSRVVSPCRAPSGLCAALTDGRVLVCSSWGTVGWRDADPETCSTWRGREPLSSPSGTPLTEASCPPLPLPPPLPPRRVPISVSPGPLPGQGFSLNPGCCL
uniref:uncharacterized protein LOC114672158 n=1 Tax=Macaca mulatta TaxID=9544 RepID=UPI0010A21099